MLSYIINWNTGNKLHWNYNENIILFKKMLLKMPSIKQRPFYRSPCVNTAVVRDMDQCPRQCHPNNPCLHLHYREQMTSWYDSGYLDLETSTLRDNRLGFVHDDVIKWKHSPRYCQLCGEFTGPRWIPHTKASDAELWCFLWSEPE